MAAAAGSKERRQGRVLMACLALLAVIAPQTAYLAPSRRAAAGALVATVMAPWEAQAERIPQAGPAGGANDPDAETLRRATKMSEAEMEAQQTEIALQQLKMEDDLKQFRDYFSQFAAEKVEIADRVGMLAKMTEMVKKDRTLPLGISREDVVKGVQAVKFNIGCVKMEVKNGECKLLEKAILKLIAMIDKVNERGLITR
eukprot:CAMPEP_0197625176 /NCGR_PEP_ID=MMETSP1338-20131121/4610_1 /TAXON_ID=43686 ORGANISM="Pelagodinium beii, Strain RCC1491" /NCGR_SAMPLE_ID=MMETSP1338 /ASSEMBLY_ACC=CAM_ASM_000754 /LENGTH=199 /DNA_ID=CAMNT_0043195507 /DNA_START=60 /DNA_END=659 /DNA_ORIENTATION=+